jgi:selenocysteine-specific elongation factor
MYVVATAGHVDHGKSTLVRALTGMEPDRWEEERRRGLTIDLGFAWGELEPGTTVAFVDVPGHERFVPNMLAGIGPVPAVLFVVAADEGWMPQSAEHLAALQALGVRHGLCVITRSDLADPEPARRQAVAEIARTSLGDIDAEVVSAVAGTGMTELRAALGRLLAGLPKPDVAAPVRLWIDRSFSIRGSGTVVTGTLAAGRLRVGDEFEVAGRTVVVRGLQSLGAQQSEVDAVARVAVNLRGIDRDALHRGDALLTPQRFHHTGSIDVRVHGDPVADLPKTVMLHVGSAAVAVRVRPLGADTARLSLAHPLPLRIGDRGLLRNPGAHHVSGGVTVLDVAPPALTRRGAAAARAKVLHELDGRPDERSELRRRGIVRQPELRRMGVTTTIAPVHDDWLIDEELLVRLRDRLHRFVSDWRRDRPLEPGPPVDAARQALRLPDRAIVHALITTPWSVQTGRIVPAGLTATLPPAIAAAVAKVQAELAKNPFAAPAAERLTELGLGSKELAAAVRAGALVRIAANTVLLPSSITDAVVVLGALPQPFTVSDARKAWDTTRRVAVPLLELLDRKGLTQRLPDDRRRLR